MANYIKLFEDETAYNEFKGSPAYITPNVSYCSGGSNSLFYNPIEKHDYSKDYFTTVAKSDGFISFSGSSTGNKLSYSTDNGTTWSTAIQKPSINVKTGDKVLWKGYCRPNSYYNIIGKFINTATFDVEGNVMSLLFDNNFKGQTSLETIYYAFNRLFADNTKIISAENLSLPATTLANECYRSMFIGCTSLTTAPELPATELAQSCYQQMFEGCTSMTTATELPATKLAQSCYSNMFSGCTSLTTAPELPAETLAQECYAKMFFGCTSLTTAPVLPATTLVYNCYQSMFRGCTSLNSITCLATDISAKYCTTDWVNGVASEGTFTKAASMTSWTTGDSGIPDGWTVNS